MRSGTTCIPPEVQTQDRCRNAPLLLAFVCLGLGSWIAINGIYQELPLIAQSAPEGFKLYAYITVLVAFAPVAVVVYVAAVSHQNAAKRSRSDGYAIYGFVGVGGVAACIMLGLVWDHVVLVAGEEHSVPLFLLMLCTGIIDNLTTILFPPLLFGFPAACVTAMQIGESLTGVLAAILAWIQDASGFSVSAFFLAMGLCMMLSCAGYRYIEISRKSMRGMLNCDAMTEMASTDLVQPHASYETGLFGSVPLHWRLFIASALLNAFEAGLFTTILASSLVQYPRASLLISLAMKGSMGLYGFFVLLAQFVRPPQNAWLPWFGMFAVVYASGTWMFFTASMEIKKASFELGVATCVVAVFSKCLAGYLKTSLFIVAQQLGSDTRALRFCGYGSLFGGLVGASCFFYLDVVSECFHSAQ